MNLNDWSTGWTLAAITLMVRAAVSRDPWWARVLAVLLALLSLTSQSLALMLRERYGEPQTRKLFLFLWEQAPYTGSLYLAGWSVFTRDPKVARIMSGIMAAVGLFPVLAVFLLLGLLFLGIGEMH